MRLAVQKTLKLYVGGKFIRSESGATVPVPGAVATHACAGSRKDLREAMQGMRKAQAGWAARSAYNRGQIVYRLAEMLEGRGADGAAVDRVVHHAGWTDKITALLSSINPVSAAYVNYSLVRPLGIVVAVPNADDGLLGLVEAACAPIVMGDAVTLLVPVALAPLATELAEALHTSDLPGGVVNVVTGDVAEMVGHVLGMDDLDALLLGDGAIDARLRHEVDTASAKVLRRVVATPRAAAPASPMLLQRLAEVQTVWMSSGASVRGGGGAY